jgi:hypothetical protein
LAARLIEKMRVALAKRNCGLCFVARNNQRGLENIFYPLATRGWL